MWTGHTRYSLTHQHREVSGHELMFMFLNCRRKLENLENPTQAPENMLKTSSPSINVKVVSAYQRSVCHR